MPCELEMQRTPKTRTIARSVHMLNNIMHGDDIGARQSSGDPEELWNVHNIATQPFDDMPKFQVPFDRGIRLEQRNNIEIFRQVTNLRGGARRTDEEVVIGPIDPAERPYDIPGVGARSELGGPPDVNCDLHGMILIIVMARRVKNSKPSLRGTRWPRMASRTDVLPDSGLR